MTEKRNTRTFWKPLLAMVCIAIGILTSGCESDPEDKTIRLIIPDYPPETNVSSGVGTAKTQWEEGDRLYIAGACLGASHLSDNNFELSAKYTGGNWIFSDEIISSAGATDVTIRAYYMIDYNDGGLVKNMSVLASDQVYPIGETIRLIPFTHYTTHLTFTGLQPGDVLSFRENWGYQIRVNDSEIDIPPFTADANGEVTIFVYINGASEYLYFRINGQPSGDNEWHKFSPGPLPAGSTHYYGLHYTIPCDGL